MSTRQEQEQREKEARDNDGGWFAEFLATLPMIFIVIAIVFGLMVGMLALEPGPFSLT